MSGGPQVYSPNTYDWWDRRDDDSGKVAMEDTTTAMGDYEMKSKKSSSPSPKQKKRKRDGEQQGSNKTPGWKGLVDARRQALEKSSEKGRGSKRDDVSPPKKQKTFQLPIAGDPQKLKSLHMYLQNKKKSPSPANKSPQSRGTPPNPTHHLSPGVPVGSVKRQAQQITRVITPKSTPRAVIPKSSPPRSTPSRPSSSLNSPLSDSSGSDDPSPQISPSPRVVLPFSMPSSSSPPRTGTKLLAKNFESLSSRKGLPSPMGSRNYSSSGRKRNAITARASPPFHASPLPYASSPYAASGRPASAGSSVLVKGLPSSTSQKRQPFSKSPPPSFKAQSSRQTSETGLKEMGDFNDNEQTNGWLFYISLIVLAVAIFFGAKTPQGLRASEELTDSYSYRWFAARSRVLHEYALPVLSPVRDAVQAWWRIFSTHPLSKPLLAGSRSLLEDLARIVRDSELEELLQQAANTAVSFGADAFRDVREFVQAIDVAKMAGLS